MSQAEYEAEIWIGYPGWPDNCNETDKQNSKDIVVCTDFQIAGTFCHHVRFFGLRFEVPKSDPVALLAQSYECTDLPGLGNPDVRTPLEEILKLKNRLESLGLELDENRYPEFAEAYIPVSGSSAWKYVKSHDLMIFKPPSEQHFDATTHLDYVGVGETYEEVSEYLRAAWEQCGGFNWFLLADPWTAVVHYPNSD